MLNRQGAPLKGCDTCCSVAALSARKSIPTGEFSATRSSMFRTLGERIGHWRYYTSAALERHIDDSAIPRKATTSHCQTLFDPTATGPPTDMRILRISRRL